MLITAELEVAPCLNLFLLVLLLLAPLVPLIPHQHRRHREVILRNSQGENFQWIRWTALIIEVRLFPIG